MYKIVLNRRGTPYTRGDKFWFIALPIFFVILGFFSYKGYHYENDKKMYDGVVKHRFENKLENTKTNEIYDIQRNFIVKFDSLPETVEINVDNDTYFSYKEGKRVSFKMSRSKLHTIPKGLEFLIMLPSILWLVNIFFLIMYIVNGIIHFKENYTLVWTSKKKEKIRKTIDPLGEEDWDD